MLDWLRRAREKPAPLTGAPPVRRLKTYSAQSGYVYQYFYEGQRMAERSNQPGTQFVFSASSDRTNYLDVSVFVSAAALGAWEKVHGRTLQATERYAVAKMALFQAFDEREKPADLSQEVEVRPADIDLIVETLGLED